jgi:hypothetical protein
MHFFTYSNTLIFSSVNVVTYKKYCITQPYNEYPNFDNMMHIKADIKNTAVTLAFCMCVCSAFTVKRMEQKEKLDKEKKSNAHALKKYQKEMHNYRTHAHNKIQDKTEKIK